MRKIWFSVLVLAIALLWIGPAMADDEVVGELFSDVPILTEVQTAAALTAKEEQLKTDPAIVRSRYVIVNFDNLAGKRFPQGAETVVLNLFADISLTAVKERVERRSATQYTWFGHIQGAKHSQVIIVVNDGSMAGNVRVNGKLYQVLGVDGGVHAISEVDQSAFPEEAPAIPVEQDSQGLEKNAPLGLLMDSSDSCTVIDVMVAYSDDVDDAVADIDSLIQLAIDETNQSYINSNVNQRVRLVHSAEVDYAETGVSSTDLGRLKDGSDPPFDDVHDWRDDYGADCVSFWVESLDACGRGYFMQTVSSSFASSAFSVVKRSNCATGYFSFGHELGHNMSAHHDCYVESGDEPYAYIHGYVNTDDRWRTIMAYDDECDDSGFDCTRIQYWSNPDVNYNGDPTGEEDGGCDANNTKTLNNTASTVASFRAEIVSRQPVSDASGPYNSQCEGATTTMSLDGSNSSVNDPCATLTYSWSTTCPDGSFDDSTSPSPELTVNTAPGCSINCDVTLTVSTNVGSDQDTALVLISDTESPLISCPSNVTVECNELIDPSNTGSATATDNCAVSPTITFTDSTLPGACSNESVITRTWRATDNCTNYSTCDQTITVVDTTPPVLTPPSNVTIECDQSTDPSNTGTATAVDNCDEAPVIIYSDVETPGSCPEEKTITRTWEATDSCGNTSKADQVINVVDTTAPVISCNASATITPPDAPISFTATATDNCDGAPSVEITEYDCYFYTKKGKLIDKEQSCVVDVSDDTITILDSGGVADNITWTVNATDGCGNLATSQCAVLVVNPGQ